MKLNYLVTCAHDSVVEEAYLATYAAAKREAKAFERRYPLSIIKVEKVAP